MIKELKLFWLKTRKQVEVYPVSFEEIKKLLIQKFNCLVEVEDNVYYTCDYKTAKLVTSLIPTKFLKYKKEVWDCDNFSKVYWGMISSLFPRLPVGRCNVKTSKGAHSLNFIIYKVGNRLSFSFIEPQESKMSYYNYKPYLMIL